MIKRLLLLAPLLLFGVVTLAQEAPKAVEPLETDRPDQTEASSVVPLYTIQFESGVLFQKDKAKGNELKEYLYPSILTRIGVLERLELRLITELQREVFETTIAGEPRTSIRKGLAPILVGTKIYVCEEKGLRPEISLIGHLQLPSGSTDFEADYVTPEFRFALSNTISDRFSVGYNTGYEWEDGMSKGKFIYTVAFATEFTEKFGNYIEFFGEKFQGEAMMHAFDGGFTYKPVYNVQFDISASVGITQNAPDMYLGAGLTVRLPK